MRPRLLIVDDEYAIRFSLESYFGDRGFAVVTAANLEEGLSRLEQAEFSAAIVDIRLPDGSGEALINIARSRHPALKFLIYTGSADYRLSPSLRTLGIRRDQVLIKPVADLGELKDRIDALLREGEPK